jgi:hypothetical protein
MRDNAEGPTSGSKIAIFVRAVRVVEPEVRRGFSFLIPILSAKRNKLPRQILFFEYRNASF